MSLKQSYPLKTTAIILMILTASTGIAYGAYSWYTTAFQVSFQDLVSNKQTISFVAIGGTNYTEAETFYCDINNAGKALTIHFLLLNTTSQLTVYFNQLNVTVHVNATSFSATTKTWFTGTTVEAGAITLPPPVNPYKCYVTVAYSAKPDVNGAVKVALGIAAEQT